MRVKRRSTTKRSRQARRRKHWNLSARLLRLKQWLRPTLISLALLIAVTAGWQSYQWLMLPTTLPIRSVTLAGELKYVVPGDLQALLQKEVEAGFFSIDLAAIKRRVESLPWVYQASLRRIWPDRLQVTIEEQRPIARWGDEGLVNRYGDIFTADATELAELPVIVGPRERCKALIADFNAADGLLYPLGLKLVSLSEDERGDQRLLLANGIRLALGRKHREQRLLRFVASYHNTLQPLIAGVARFDLRYPNGFAVQWKEGMLRTGTLANGGAS